MKNILYINSCVREESRTERIAKELLSRLGNDFCELNLAELNLKPLTKEKLNLRTAMIEKNDYDDCMFDLAKQFAAADIIVISAPYWDLSFPALLKTYIENIYITGIVSEYGVDGRPRGLCKAEKLYYVTTSGGPLIQDFGYGYIKTLATDCFGIKETKLIKAEMLDVDGFDADITVAQTIKSLDKML